MPESNDADADSGGDTADVGVEPDQGRDEPDAPDESVDVREVVTIRLPDDVALFEGDRIVLEAELTFADESTATVAASTLPHVNTNPDVAVMDAGELIALRRGTTSFVFDGVAPDGGPAVLNVTVQFGYRDIAVGGFHACGLSTAGKAYCWGLDGNGQSGTYDADSCDFQFFRACTATCDGCCGGVAGCGTAESARAQCRETTTARCAKSPVRVETDATFTRLSAGYYHTCGLTDDGRVLCWGMRELGEFGDPADQPEMFETVDVTPSFPVRSIHLSVHHTCVVSDEDGSVHCRGWNTFEQLGVAEADSASCGNQLCVLQWHDTGMSGEKGVAVLYLGVCAMDEEGTVRCVGKNAYGYFRDVLSTVDGSLEPLEVGGPYEQLVGGIHHLCGGRNDGLWECWGWNAFRQIDTTQQELAVAPTLIGMFEVVTPGAYHTCGVRADGTVECWGRNEQGQLGRPTEPPGGNAGQGPIDTELKFTDVASGVHFACAIEAETRQAHCWGANPYGQLGDGQNDNSPEVYGPTVRRVLPP